MGVEVPAPAGLGTSGPAQGIAGQAVNPSATPATVTMTNEQYQDLLQRASNGSNQRARSEPPHGRSAVFPPVGDQNGQKYYMISDQASTNGKGLVACGWTADRHYLKESQRAHTDGMVGFRTLECLCRQLPYLPDALED